MLEVKNLSKSFRMRENRMDSLKSSLAHLFSQNKAVVEDFHALKNVSFNLHQGEALGIIGKNGAGKSTLLRILSGISQPDEGEINFYGKAVSILDIGAGFHPELTGRENIYLSASLYKFTRKKIDERFNEIVEFSGIEKFIDEPVKNYSSGMYLRLAFSIITCLDADIYLIDEVINVGDANFQMKCKNRIEKLIAEGKTLLIASHNMNEISVLCNRLILMEHGKVIETGGADIIQKYMTLALPKFFNFETGEFFHIKRPEKIQPINTSIKTICFAIEDFTPGIKGISINHTFKIVINIETTHSLRYVIGLRVYEVSGVLVFVCSTLKNTLQITEPGKYRIVFEMPAHIFNETMYSFDCKVYNIDTQAMLYREDKFLTLKMSDDEPVGQAEAHDYQSGIIKPLYHAETTRLA